MPDGDLPAAGHLHLSSPAICKSVAFLSGADNSRRRRSAGALLTATVASTAATAACKYSCRRSSSASRPALAALLNRSSPAHAGKAYTLWHGSPRSCLLVCPACELNCNTCACSVQRGPMAWLRCAKKSSVSKGRRRAASYSSSSCSVSKKYCTVSEWVLGSTRACAAHRAPHPPRQHVGLLTGRAKSLVRVGAQAACQRARSTHVTELLELCTSALALGLHLLCQLLVLHHLLLQRPPRNVPTFWRRQDALGVLHVCRRSPPLHYTCMQKHTAHCRAGQLTHPTACVVKCRLPLTD